MRKNTWRISMDLREYLFRNDIKVTQFAKKIGYNNAYLGNIMHGLYEPSPRLAQAISDATDGIVSKDGICSRKRGKALEIAKKACEHEQMTFAEIQNK
jgi:transcriptional regulator with XRE-family HTH domain